MCVRPYRRAHYHQNPEPYKKRAVESRKAKVQWFFDLLLTKKCVDCGEDDPVVLEFDHVRGQKSGDISQVLLTKSRKALLEELSKCDVRCANCHKKRTAKEKGWYKYLTSRGIR